MLRTGLRLHLERTHVAHRAAEERDIAHALSPLLSAAIQGRPKALDLGFEPLPLSLGSLQAEATEGEPTDTRCDRDRTDCHEGTTHSLISFGWWREDSDVGRDADDHRHGADNHHHDRHRNAGTRFPHVGSLISRLQVREVALEFATRRDFELAR